MDNEILDTPDDCGWYFFKPSKKAPVVVVYINDDGVGFAMNEEGESYELDDLIGFWESIEPEKI